MKIEPQPLPNNRARYVVSVSEAETADYYEGAVSKLAKGVKITGFRPGKAPEYLIRENLDSSKLREEAYNVAVGEAWRQLIRQSKAIPISDPEVTLETFEEGKSARIIFEFDVRPQVKVSSWSSISLKPDKESTITDDDVAKLIDSLSQAHASSVAKLEPAAKGDKMEVNFTGSIGGVRQDKLSAKHFPLILGQGTTIPGFDDNLTGLKKGEEKTFNLEFPIDHFDKALAGKAAEFKVEVNEVFQVILPELNKEFAERFGHKTVDALKKAIRQDLARQRYDEAFTAQKAKWLAQFEQKVTVDVPVSLINAEVERSRQAWRQFLQERHLNEADWLKSRELTLEQLEKDWQKAAQASVKIGLGLAEVAKEMKKELKSNEEFQELLDQLVGEAIKKS